MYGVGAAQSGGKDIDKIAKEFAVSHSLDVDNVFAFAVQESTASRRVFYFVAASLTEGRQWVAALERVIAPRGAALAGRPSAIPAGAVRCETQTTTVTFRANPSHNLARSFP